MKEFTGDVTPMMASSLRPGIRAHLVAAGRHERAGGVDSRRDVAGAFHRERFRDGSASAQRVIPLTFSITLENFEVPRDEGTDTPVELHQHAALRGAVDRAAWCAARRR